MTLSSGNSELNLHDPTTNHPASLLAFLMAEVLCVSCFTRVFPLGTSVSGEGVKGISCSDLDCLGALHADLQINQTAASVPTH